ncbi:MAG: UDP-N-acetylmuramoyl-tripeptide--D-alanyl-D-alanine ligase [Roseburia sp.]|nr:UDP-N-acetylmuramoyl-tripeptide--D-alanyl-D-alanine ligase [Roseburia sp.]
MKNMTLKNIAEAVGGALHAEHITEGVDVDVTEAAGVVLDSRQVGAGYIFIATKGERVDGHSFIDRVFESGAMGVICEKAPETPKGAYILVKDSFQALKDVAEYYRRQLDIKVIGITGSVGKTSAKEFIASVVSRAFRTLKTEGNFNNEVGLPLTVLRIREDCEVAVLEMGISDFGEMHRLSKIARPDICVITNIGQCHLENLGTRDGILKAKSEIFDFMNAQGSVCLNGDDNKLAAITEVKGQKPLFFGMEQGNAVRATDYVHIGPEGSRVTIHINADIPVSFTATIPLPGEHMVYNALAAAAVGLILGMTAKQIQAGLEAVEPVGGRSHVIRTESFTIIDDCYNANPVSMKAAIDLLAQIAQSRRVAIMGDMFELGGQERRLHREVGEYAAESNPEVIICVGGLCRDMADGARSVERSESSVYYFKDKAELLTQLKELLHTGDTVLVKASHGMHFEELIPVIERGFQGTI